MQRDYTVTALSRRTIDAGSEPALANRSFGAVVSFDLPGMAERAMYFGDTPLYSGGHAAAGITTPATSWFLAEGATGSYFDTFVLIANPNPTAVNLTVTYLPEGGTPIVKTSTLAANQRTTLNIAIRGSRAGERRRLDAGRVQSARDRGTRAGTGRTVPGRKRTTARARPPPARAGGWRKAA